MTGLHPSSSIPHKHPTSTTTPDPITNLQRPIPPTLPGASPRALLPQRVNITAPLRHTLPPTQYPRLPDAKSHLRKSINTSASATFIQSVIIGLTDAKGVTSSHQATLTTLLRPHSTKTKVCTPPHTDARWQSQSIVTDVTAYVTRQVAVTVKGDTRLAGVP